VASGRSRPTRDPKHATAASRVGRKASRARLKAQPPARSPSPPPETCAWCSGSMPEGLRREAKFCSTRCLAVELEVRPGLSNAPCLAPAPVSGPERRVAGDAVRVRRPAIPRQGMTTSYNHDSIFTSKEPLDRRTPAYGRHHRRIRLAPRMIDKARAARARHAATTPATLPNRSRLPRTPGIDTRPVRRRRPGSAPLMRTSYMNCNTSVLDPPPKRGSIPMPSIASSTKLAPKAGANRAPLALNRPADP
jgi:hypothetical protein